MTTRAQGLVYAALVLMLALGAYLRVVMVDRTVVNAPVRADAAEYFAYAYNLRHHGVYSRTWPWNHDGAESPGPDALRNPGYPLFLTPFVDGPPTLAMLARVTRTQALLSTVVILLAFVLARPLVGARWALLPALLVCLSPHLVASNIYLLTESLYTFAVLFFALAMAWLLFRPAKTSALVAGLLLALGVLVRPTTLYLIWFVLPFLFLALGTRQARRLGVFLILGFALAYAPWATRNQLNPGDTGKSSLAVESVHNGMYPGFMYENIPESYGHPYAYVPDFESVQSMRVVLREIGRRFLLHPGEYAYWYFIGKPATYLSWNIIQGMGDVFVYPVEVSPYHVDKVFIAFHAVMRQLHAPLMVLGLLGGLLVWLPARVTGLAGPALQLARLCALVVVYFLLVHIAATPLPRYAIPIYPVIYLLATVSLATLGRQARRLRAPGAATDERVGAPEHGANRRPS